MKICSAIIAFAVAAAVCARAENTALVPVPRDFPTNWISQHEANLAAAKKGGVDILFLGDSITAGWNWGNGGAALWEKTYAPQHAANFGIGWDRIQNVLWRVENGELDGIAPKVVVLLIGTNNTGDNSAPEIVEGISNLVGRIRVHLPSAKIILFGIFPRGEKTDSVRAKIKTINAGLAQLADRKIKFMDIGEKFLTPEGSLPREMFPDLLHPNSSGYQIWSDALNPVLQEMQK